MKFPLLILVILASALASADDLTKAEQLAKTIALCDAKVMQLCESNGNAKQNGMRSCVRDAIVELDTECRLLIDKEMRKGNLIEAKSAKSGARFKFLETLKKNN